MLKSKKDKIIYKLTNPFSYTGATVPETASVQGKEVKIKPIVEEFKKREQGGKLTSQDILFGATLSRLLENEIQKIINKMNNEEISTEEAEKNMDTWLGIIRASKILNKQEESVDQRKIEKDEKVRFVKWAKSLLDPALFSYNY
ncbi:MAG: DUF5788 family protein [Candidatus Freyarchaeum deiterrae]